MVIIGPNLWQCSCGAWNPDMEPCNYIPLWKDPGSNAKQMKRQIRRSPVVGMPARRCSATASSSAEQPGKRLAIAIGSAEQPATKRARAPSSVQAVAFITCAENAQDFATNRDRHNLLQAVRNALDSGAMIINIAFSRAVSKDRVDTGCILPELQQLFDEVWKNTVGQAAYSFRRCGSVMSFFTDAGGAVLSEKCLDPEGCLPALMLTFDAPQGPLCIVNASVANIPTRTRMRLLKYYVDAAEKTDCESILIGGEWQDTEFQILFMENQVTKMDVEFQLFTDANLCLLTHSPHNRPVECFALDTDGPYSFMCIWNRNPSVEPPASDVSSDNVEEAVKLMPATPLYDNLIVTLEQGQQCRLVDNAGRPARYSDHLR